MLLSSSLLIDNLENSNLKSGRFEQAEPGVVINTRMTYQRLRGCDLVQAGAMQARID
jgi:hypothetical protein